MQTISDFASTSHPGGGRSGSPLHRQLQRFCEDFAGLEKDTNRYDLLLLVKRAGKAAGFTPKMIQLLDHYMAFTRDCDWDEGARPIVYQSQAKTSLDLGVSERQIQRLEQALGEIGAITFNDSGNHRRFGQRCPETGMILYAYGVDLTPLAALKPELEAKLAEKRERDEKWLELKRKISAYRAKIRTCIAELEGWEEGALASERQTRYEQIAVPIRTYMDMESLEALLSKHRMLHESILALLQKCQPSRKAAMSDKASPKDDKDVVHYKTTNQEPSDESDTGRQVSGIQECVGQPSEHQEADSREEGPPKEENVAISAGLHHITHKQMLNAASERFREHIPMRTRPMDWHDLVEAAYSLRPVLHISQQSWAEACVTLGRNGAAVCLLLTDRATFREKDPVLKPAAYFNTMIRRARKRELNLQRSIFGILKREEGGQ